MIQLKRTLRIRNAVRLTNAKDAKDAEAGDAKGY